MPTYEGVYKRGNVWWVRIELPGDDASGRRKRHAEACPGKNQHQAKAYRDKLLADLSKGIYVDHADKTVQEYLQDWLKQSESQLAVTTHETYTYAVRKYLIPHLGKTRITKLRPADIQTMYTKLKDDVKLSTKTIKNIHGVLHKALAKAVKLQMVNYNVADMVEPPRLVRKEINSMPIEDASRLIAAISTSPFRTPILIALATGMRKGEILGLKWNDVDLTHEVIIVRRSIYQVTGKVGEKETKTYKTRVVKIPRFLIDVLKQHAESQRQQGIYQPCGWVCARSDGEVCKPRALAYEFTKLRTTHKLDYTLHGLRHTQATALIMAGVPAKVVSERLGHANISITQDIYTHVLPHMQDEAVEIIDSVLSPLVNSQDTLGVQNGYKSASEG